MMYIIVRGEGLEKPALSPDSFARILPKCQLGFAWLSIVACAWGFGLPSVPSMGSWIAKLQLHWPARASHFEPPMSQTNGSTLAGLVVFKRILNVNYSNSSWNNFHSNVLALRPADRCDSCTCSIVHQLWCELIWVVWACEEHATNPKEVSIFSTWYDETYILDIFAERMFRACPMHFLRTEQGSNVLRINA